MAPKAISIYTVDELATLDREQLKQFRDNIDEAMARSEENAMKEISDMVAKFGIDPKQLALFLKVPVQSAGAGVGGAGDAPARTASGGRAKDPEMEAAKQQHQGKTVIDRASGKEYTFGTKGPVPKWVKDNIKEIMNGGYDFKDDSAPGVEGPKEAAE